MHFVQFTAFTHLPGNTLRERNKRVGRKVSKQVRAYLDFNGVVDDDKKTKKESA